MVVDVLCAGCGGGTTGEVAPPPPSPDVVLSISPTPQQLVRDTTSSATPVNVQSLNGFSDDVQMALSGMPSGITTNPLSPFTVQSGGSATLLIAASATASTSSASVLVQGSSGALAHSSSIALTAPPL